MSELQVAFPWLVGLDTHAVETAESDPRALRLLVDMAIESRSQLPVPALTPHVPYSFELSRLDLSARPANRLREMGASTFGDLESRSVAGFFTVPKMGAGSIHELLRQLFKLNLDEFAGPTASETPSSATAAPKWTPEVPLHRSMAGYHLEVLAHWSKAIARPDLALVLHDPDDARLPTSVRESAAWLATVSATDVPVAETAVSTLLQESLTVFDERQRYILDCRQMHDPAITLESIGSTLGVTRERVRQLAGRVQAVTAGWLDGESDLGLASAGIRFQASPVITLARLIDANPDLETVIEGLDRPTWYVLDKLDDGFESDGTWVAVPSLGHAASETNVRFSDYANDHGAATITDAMAAFDAWSPLRPDELMDWLEHLGYSFVDDFVFGPSVRSIPERAAAFLSMVDAPQSVDVIHQAACPDRSLVGLRNQLTGDPDTFSRTGRSTFGLAEWGLRRYSTVKDAIGELVDDAGGSVALEDVVHDLSSSFGVAPGSITTYAHAWPFEVVGGSVRRASQPRASERIKSLAEVRNVYQDGDAFLFRTVVTHDHLRGSGTNISTGLARLLGVQEGHETAFQNEFQPVKVRWTGLQPTIGSLRVLVTALDAAIDDGLRLRFGQTGDVTAYLIPRDTGSSIESRISTLLDVPKVTYGSVAQRIGIDRHSSRSDILKALRARGETDLADLIADPALTLEAPPDRS